jgi:transmembrane sensor
MSRPTIRNSPEIVAEAAEWFVTMRDPSTSLQQREAFSEWLRASPMHIQAYLDVTRTWGDAAHLGTQLDEDLERQLAGEGGTSNVVQLRDAGLPRDSQATPIQSRVSPRGMSSARRGWLAASLVIGLIGLGALFWASPRETVYAAGLGEQRTISLRDGSVVTLNSKSAIAVHMYPDRREVVLRSGQAWFDVAKDRSRPFLVHSGDAVVRAVGTQFDVYRKNSRTIVTVVEGRVAVSSAVDAAALVAQRDSKAAAAPQGSTAAVPSGAAPVLLSAGQQVVVPRGGRVQAPSPVNIAAATSWLQRELVFNGESLATVIEEFNRYSDTPIVLADESLGELRVNAVFHTTSAQSLLRFVSRLDDVKVETTDHEIKISRRP